MGLDRMLGNVAYNGEKQLRDASKKVTGVKATKNVLIVFTHPSIKRHFTDKKTGEQYRNSAVIPIDLFEPLVNAIVADPEAAAAHMLETVEQNRRWRAELASRGGKVSTAKGIAPTFLSACGDGADPFEQVGDAAGNVAEESTTEEQQGLSRLLAQAESDPKVAAAVRKALTAQAKTRASAPTPRGRTIATGRIPAVDRTAP